MDTHFPGELKAADQVSREIVFIYFTTETAVLPSFTCHSSDTTCTDLSCGCQRGREELSQVSYFREQFLSS